MRNRTADQLAKTLEYLVTEGLVPGLLPADVSAAADLLRAQDAELATLRKAIAANLHHVNLKVTREAPCRRKFRAEFVIADPRLYYAELAVDDLAWLSADRSDTYIYIGRQLARVGTAEWMRQIEEQAVVAVARALRDSDGSPKGEKQQALSA